MNGEGPADTYRSSDVPHQTASSSDNSNFSMRDTLISIPVWVYSLLVVSLGPPAAYLGTLWGWTPGAASLAVLTVPTSVAALSGNRTTAGVVAVLAGVGGFLELLFHRPEVSGAAAFAFPLFGGSMLLLVAVVVASTVESLRQRLAQLEEQTTQYVRELYRRSRNEEENQDRPPQAGGRLAAAAATAGTETLDSTRAGTSLQPNPGPTSVSDNESVNYPMLLLTLQDIGRRVSTSLDLETLIPTIVSTGKASLKCGDCQVYYWNGRDGSLKRPLPRRARDREAYLPRPQVGMTRWVLKHRQILTRQAVEEDYTLQGLFEEDPDMPDAIAPLAVGGELLGLLVVDKVEQDSPTFVRLLYILANIYALGIKNAQLFNRIEEMARRDGLTGLLNHASFQDELQTMVERAEAESFTLSLVMSDVDHFKKFNDTYGHQAGDHVLREVSRLWKSILPDYAVLARYGGEEFICVLPGDDRERGRELAEQLREHIESHCFDFEGRPLRVTASFGVAEWSRGGQSPQELIRLADEALYNAKEAGRNRVVCDPGVPLMEVSHDANLD